MKSAMAPASACSRRNSDRGAAISPASRRSSRAPVGPRSAKRKSAFRKDHAQSKSKNLAREFPVRTDRARYAIEGAGHQLDHQHAIVIDRPGHGRPALRHLLEAGAAVIGLITDQQHQPMALRLGIVERAFE